MTTLLLATGNSMIGKACRDFLEGRGYCVIRVERPLAVLGLAVEVNWDAGLVDASDLGRGVVDALQLMGRATRLLGLGLADSRLAESVDLPLESDAVEAAVLRLTRGEEPPARLRLDADRRLAYTDDAEILLTRTEFRLLDLFMRARPSDVPLPE